MRRLFNKGCSPRRDWEKLREVPLCFSTFLLTPCLSLTDGSTDTERHLGRWQMERRIHSAPSRSLSLTSQINWDWWTILQQGEYSLKGEGQRNGVDMLFSWFAIVSLRGEGWRFSGGCLQKQNFNCTLLESEATSYKKKQTVHLLRQRCRQGGARGYKHEVSLASVLSHQIHTRIYTHIHTHKCCVVFLAHHPISEMERVTPSLLAGAAGPLLF